MKKNKINEKTIRLIRFCKNNNLYYYIFSKYKNIDYLDTILYRCNAENCFMQMIHYGQPKFNTKYNPFISEKVNITFLNNEWKKFVKDLIEDEEKRKKKNEEMLKALQTINNSYFVFPHSYVPSYLQENNYEDDSDYGGLVDYFNFLKNL